MSTTVALARRRINPKFFWYFNISFWLFLALTNLMQVPRILSVKEDLIFLILHFVFGVILGYLLHRLLYQRFNFHLFRTGVLIVLVLIYSILFGAIRNYFYEMIAYFSYGEFLIPAQPIVFIGNVLRSAFHFITWSAIYFSLRLYEEAVRQRHEAQQARLMAQGAQLEVLRYQLNPHFLFNTLSSLRALTTRDPRKAKEVVTKISEFLRYSLLEAKENKVPLSREIEIIRHYLDIERIQYGRNLKVRLQIDPQAEDCEIPVLILHPLVENAVKHGMKTSGMPLEIALNVDRPNGELRISVSNTGRWIDNTSGVSESGTGTGLVNVRKRLQHFFPGTHRFEIHKDESSVCVRMILLNEALGGTTQEL